MSTTSVTPVLSPDDAYTQFKTVEGTLTSVQAASANASAALVAAQSAATQSQADLSAAETAVVTASEALIAAVRAYEASFLPATTVPELV